MCVIKLFLTTVGRMGLVSYGRRHKAHIQALSHLAVLFSVGVTSLSVISCMTSRFTFLYLTVYSFRGLPAGVYDATAAGWLDLISFLH